MSYSIRWKTLTAEEKASIVDTLTGSSGVYDDTVARQYKPELDGDDLEAVMEEAECFRCETCGWWCGPDEISDQDNVCTECADD